MLRVVSMCFALMLAPTLVHADMDDMGGDMDDMGDMAPDDMTLDLDPGDMDADLAPADMETDVDPDMADMGADVGPDIPEPSYLFEGVVSLEDGANLAGTLVTLIDGDVELQATTSVSGAFSITEVPRGFYELEVSREGYLTHRERVNLQAPYNLELKLLVFAESAVVIEVFSEFSPIELTLDGNQTVEESLTTNGGVAVWEGMLSRGVWHGTVVADGRLNRQFQIEVGKNSEPISTRVFINESPEPTFQTESGCGCTTSSVDSSWLVIPFLLVVGWVRRRWVS